MGAKDYLSVSADGKGYVSHGVKINTRGAYEAEEEYKRLQAFRENLKTGDRFLLPSAIVGIEHDNDIPDPMEFVVVKKYPQCVVLKHKSPFTDYVHVYTPNYVTLMQEGEKLETR